MEVLKLLAFIVLLVTFVQNKKTKEKLHEKMRRIHVRGLPPNCHAVCDDSLTNQNEEQSSGEDYDDAGDNETAIEMTSLPPGYYNDVYLNNEDAAENDVRQDPENPTIDFIVIKHRYSNETNQAFPPYAFAGRNKKAKQTRNKKKDMTKRHGRERRKQWRKPVQNKDSKTARTKKTKNLYP